MLQLVDIAAHGPSWQGIAVAAGGLLQIGVLAWMRANAEERKEQAARIAMLDAQVVALNTLVGVHGNGIIGRLDSMNTKLDKVLNEQAELRGASLHHRES